MEQMKHFLDELAKNNAKVKRSVFFKVQNAKEKSESLLKKYLTNFQPKKEYDEIYNWLEDNKGRGLLLVGTCGLGKSLFSQIVIPYLLLKECRLQVNIIKAVDLQENFKAVKNRKILSVDDVGIEPLLNEYGQKRDCFCELMDKVDTNGTLIIATTNLNAKQLEERYGKRTLDRLRGNMEVVVIKGNSMR